MWREIVSARWLVIAALLLAPGCMKTLHERDLLYPRKVGIVAEGATRENIEIMASDSTVLRGWCIRPPAPRGSLIYFYGNAETVSSSQQRLFWLATRYQLTVFALDYRGYGFSDGSAVGRLLFEDVVAVYDTLRARASTPPEPPLVYGRSLGSFLGLHLAALRPLKGLVLEGSVPRITDALPGFRRMIPWYVRWAIRLRLGQDLLDYEQPIETIGKIATPLLVIHGEQDGLFPASLARRMYDRSPAIAKTWCLVPGAGHNNVSISEEPVRACLDEFLNACLRDPTGKAENAFGKIPE